MVKEAHRESFLLLWLRAADDQSITKNAELA